VIRSRFANAFILILGLLFLSFTAVAVVTTLKETPGAKFVGLQDVLPITVFLILGVWCTRGSLINLRHARDEPAESLSFSLVALRTLSVVLSSALVVTVVGVVLLFRGNDSFAVERLILVAAATLAYGALALMVLGVVHVVRR
jgi:hypothetical protein